MLLACQNLAAGRQRSAAIFHFGAAPSQHRASSATDSTHPPEHPSAAPALAEVVKRAQAGEERATTALIELYQKRVAGYVFRLLCEPSAVDDVCQIIFLQMCRSLRSLREVARFEPWLFRIARNACYSHRRKERLRRLFTPLLPVHEAVISAEAVPLSGELAAVNEALKQLSLRDRELLALCTQDYSYEQMAAITGLTVTNFKTRLFRARQALKRILSHE